MDTGTCLLTLINTEAAIPLCIGEKVFLTYPSHPHLPVKVTTREGEQMGYLGLNQFTTRPQCISSCELNQLLETNEVIEVTVLCHTHHASQQIILEARYQAKEETIERSA